MKTERMQYRRYKEHYADCGTVGGSYDKTTKTIEVIIPDGRMKKSGTRGQTYHYVTFHGVKKSTGKPVYCAIKAVSTANAIKRLPDGCEWDLSDFLNFA